ncbi:MAG: twin-arginine translocase TatA/TatE family subunit [Microbacterium sp.]|uniref:twin-arginine translocase TatA/TatE family subunit n=1 Tax=Microbacterium sp. TaxID=51671 RepID=UPI000925BAB3|nr:twin-arginine translocase TatA/TatE family subunit [Microbacterium sp.]OJU67833.1 MAG: Sec-independent protein translocase TatA [Microbacterium sp. 70-38]MBN9152617.1 twin-arginine translocase TatA/TatE family subunit [Microbacterium sp.]MBN9169702.1 twin-arginine translocase TatA/TatE family subunit [Microbacterium sp.]MBN9171464.1 twin-arginine translocase TatA/TatE family subunit [Microbacterium sp.]MBN9174789.1 twin-arginine translocase TatA/TatE family subunit [Microbacterium sp.]
MLGNLTGWHFLALLAIVLLVFGAAKLPALAKSMGQSARVFKGEMKAMKEDDAASAPKVESIQAPPTVAPVSTEAPVARSSSPDTHS